MNNPYDIAPAIFLLDRLNSSPSFSDKKLINTLGLRLVNGQRRPLDLWRYTVPILNSKQEEKLKEDIENKTFQRPYPPNPNDVDMSCSQFAALGLWTAKRHGIKQDNGFDPLKEGAEEALAKAAYQVREQQNLTAGTWNYAAGTIEKSPYKDTSTCCGLIILCLGEAVKDKPQPILKDERAILALKHLEKVIKNNKNPRAFHPDAHGSFYFLWALERTALILNLTRIGEEADADGEKGQDWHKWGNKIVLARQNKGNGSWIEGNGAVPDTCFALLFLQRANLFKDLTDKLHGITRSGAALRPSGPPAPVPAPARPRDV